MKNIIDNKDLDSIKASIKKAKKNGYNEILQEYSSAYDSIYDAWKKEEISLAEKICILNNIRHKHFEVLNDTTSFRHFEKFHNLESVHFKYTRTDFQFIFYSLRQLSKVKSLWKIELENIPLNYIPKELAEFSSLEEIIYQSHQKIIIDDSIRNLKHIKKFIFKCKIENESLFDELLPNSEIIIL